jgi:hypothetical protein
MLLAKEELEPMEEEAEEAEEELEAASTNIMQAASRVLVGTIGYCCWVTAWVDPGAYSLRTCIP